MKTSLLNASRAGSSQRHGLHPGRAALRILFPAGLAMMLSLAGDLTLYAVLPAYAASLAISLAAVGVLLSANRLVRLVSNPLVGLLAGRVSRRRLFLSGLTTGIASTLLYILARDFVPFLLGRLLWGISWSMIYIGIFLMMMDTLAEEDRGWGSGLVQTFYFIGLAVTPLLGGLLSGWLGFSPALLVCAALQGAGLAVAAFFLPETRLPLAQSQPALPLNLKAAWQRFFEWGKNFSVVRVFQRSDLVRGFQRNDLARVFQRGDRLAAFYLYLLVLFAGDGIIMSTITLYLKQRYGDALSLGQAVLPVAGVGGAFLALRAVVSAGAAPLAGVWSDRNGSRWVVAAWGALLAVGGCGLLGLDGAFALVLVGVALTAFGIAMVMAVLPAVVSLGAGERGGLYVGLLNTAGDIGCAIAPLVGYTLLGNLSLSSLYLVTGGLLLTGLCAALWVGQKSRKGQPAPTALAGDPPRR